VNALLELVVSVNNPRWSRVLLYLPRRLTTMSLDLLFQSSWLEIAQPLYDIKYEAINTLWTHFYTFIIMLDILPNKKYYNYTLDINYC